MPDTYPNGAEGVGTVQKGLFPTRPTLANYTQTRKAVLELSQDLIDQTSQTIIEKTNHFMKPAEIYVWQAARLVEDGVLELPNNPRLENYAIETVKSVKHLTMFNIADEHGNFLMPKKQPDGRIDTKIINRNVDPPTGVWVLRDFAGNVVERKRIEKVKYDPRKRPWYIGAAAKKGTYWSPMYILFTDQIPGVTVAEPVLDKDGNVTGVMGLDIELRELSEFLRNLKNGLAGLDVGDAHDDYCWWSRW